MIGPFGESLTLKQSEAAYFRGTPKSDFQQSTYFSVSCLYLNNIGNSQSRIKTPPAK